VAAVGIPASLQRLRDQVDAWQGPESRVVQSPGASSRAVLQQFMKGLRGAAEVGKIAVDARPQGLGADPVLQSQKEQPAAV